MSNIDMFGDLRRKISYMDNTFSIKDQVFLDIDEAMDYARNELPDKKL